VDLPRFSSIVAFRSAKVALLSRSERRLLRPVNGYCFVKTPRPKTLRPRRPFGYTVGMNETPKSRRWFQFSLRTLLVVMLLASMALGWVTAKMQQAKRQREAVAALQDFAGGFGYDYQRSKIREILAPSWLRGLLGDDFFGNVDDLCVGGVTDREMVHIASFHRLKVLRLVSCDITDAGLAQIKGITQLEELDVPSTQITDTGLEHLTGMNQLRRLGIGETQITDAGLKHLKGMSQLQDLYLSGTKVTDAGLENLRGLSQLRSLHLNKTGVTDAGLERLRGLSQLEFLGLSNTGVTDAGLDCLEGLPHLQWLSIEGSHVTDVGVKNLQNALPRCTIHH